MATSSVFDFRRLTATVRRTLEPIWSPLHRAFRFVKGSFFRFLIFFGIVLLVLAATVVQGTAAGHFGIYGASAVFIGVLGRAIAYLKIRGSV